MKANLEKLKELSLAELITINEFNIARFNVISLIPEEKRTKTAKKLFEQLNIIGYEFEELISEKLNDFIIE